MSRKPKGSRLQFDVIAPDFTLCGTDGKEYNLHRQKGEYGTVIIFSCNHCPYVQAYDARINDLAQQYMSRGIAFFVINSNDPHVYADDSFEKMQEKVSRQKLVYPYLHDATQQVAIEYGAGCTPEVFAFDDHLKLIYTGRIDDNMEYQEKVTQRYLRDTCESMLGHRHPQIRETHPIGCSIKWHM